MRIIINADDLGKNTAVNDAIFDLMRRGIVTSATIMANGAAAEECIPQIASYPHCSFGVHLNITEFRPLAPHPSFRELLDEEGLFSLANYRNARFHAGLREAVFGEWSAQVRLLQSRGVAISHIDSHHGVHTDTRLFPVLKRLQIRFGIRRVRIAVNVSSDPGVRFRRNRLWNFALRYIYSSKTTCCFTQFASFLELAEGKGISCPSVELMVHPGHPGFEAETKALAAPWTDRMPFPVHLINYFDL